METFITVAVLALILAIVIRVASRNGEKSEKADVGVKHPVNKQVKDFFKIDIDNLWKYEKTQKDERTYEIRLEKLELGCFYKVEIIDVGDGTYNVVFYGRDEHDYSFPAQLREFLDFCARTFGLDFGGHDHIGSAEDEYVKAGGMFDRKWLRNGKVWLTRPTKFAPFELTLFGIKGCIDKPKSVQGVSN